jgi:hypothetical protein
MPRDDEATTWGEMVEALRIMGIMTLSSPAQPASALRRVANASARSPGAAAGRKAVWDHCGTIRVQRRLMHDEASARLNAADSTTHETEERVMGGLGVQELLIILVIALLFCGGKKLPEIG